AAMASWPDPLKQTSLSSCWAQPGVANDKLVINTMLAQALPIHFCIGTPHVRRIINQPFEIDTIRAAAVNVRCAAISPWARLQDQTKRTPEQPGFSMLAARAAQCRLGVVTTPRRAGHGCRPAAGHFGSSAPTPDRSRTGGTRSGRRRDRRSFGRWPTAEFRSAGSR